MKNSNRRRLLLWIVVAAIGGSGSALSSAHAQNSLAGWPEKAKNHEFTQLKAVRIQYTGRGTALHTGDFQDKEDEDQFVAFYTRDIFPKITDPSTRGTRDDPIAQLHNAFGRLERHRDSPVFNKLADITLDYMTKIAEDGKFHPAARINATLAMGEVKSPKAVDALMNMIRNRQLEPVFKVAAMADLVQLAEQGVLSDPAVSAPVVALMTKAAAAQIHTDELRWMRGQAADILGAVRSTGKAGEVPAALMVMLNDADLPLTQRGKAARALGRLEYQGGPPNPADYCKALAAFGSDALTPDLPAEVRRINSVARDVLDGLEPLKPLAAKLGAVKEIFDAMKKLQKEVATPRRTSDDEASAPPSEEALKTAMADARAALDAVAGKSAPPRTAKK